MSKMLSIYLGSAELKKELIARSIKYEIPFKYVCSEIGINYDEFMRSYINSTSSNLDIAEEKFSDLLTMFGIEVRVQFVTHLEFGQKALRDRLKEKYAG